MLKPVAALALALLSQPSLAQAVATAAKQSIMPTNPRALEFQTTHGFSDAVVHGDTIYLSGVVAGPVSKPEDLPAAYERAFQRIADVLKRAGASWDDVVEMTTFHTDMPTQMRHFSPVKNRWVKAPFPAWTAIGISALYEPTAVTEIKVVARKAR